ncbi:MAG: amino acid ABC transporter substrate-binding protein [Caldilineaceae bacterium]|nr:amino acid ABC transporter substrate-binding protein [Caldilineaceae bacterium]MBP8108965.1 amino acid ABC transporter substrate-binding protein [Caldilineaceae bacterium]MBP8124854.1 amino acid ABC transporter substrate-binding protein [Caldilineaceae bacterium]MBP9074132.1 amino acid ABC transporter substrate-binding protein [Caldilineaceae bacterium]
MNKRTMMLTAFLLVLVIVMAACAGAAPATGQVVEVTREVTVVVEVPAQGAAPAANAGGLLQAVQARGELVCGVNSGLAGFASLDSSGNYTGFDADFCRAVAAAILGDASKVQFRPLSSGERFTAVQTGEVDVLFRNSTWTLTRDSAEVGMEWMPVTFYDGQGMMVRKDSGIVTLEDMDGATVCVQSGTTTELNLADNFRARGIDFTAVVFDNNDLTVEAYDQGRCDGFTTDKSGLVSSRTRLVVPTDHVILDVTMSKEPLAGAVFQGDPTWADAVRWTIFGMIEAEEYGITAANVDEMMGSDNPNIKRLLGVEAEMGTKLGLSNDFLVTVLKAVGNYGEVYDRNLGPTTPFSLPRGQNTLYTQGGLLYAPPFR